MPYVVTRARLQELLSGPDRPFLVEVGPLEGYRRAHLPGALQCNDRDFNYLGLEGKHAHLDEYEMMLRLPPDRNAAIVLYGDGSESVGPRRAAAFLERAFGFRNVMIYEGGKDDWEEAGLAVESDIEPVYGRIA